MPTLSFTLSSGSSTDFAKYRIFLGEILLGEGIVPAGAPATLDFEVPAVAAGTLLAVEHYHDTATRSLRVDRIALDGAALDLATATEDVGPRDGRDVESGAAARELVFNGTFLLALPTDVAGEPPPPPEPVPEEPPPPPPGTGEPGRIIVHAHKEPGSDFSKFKLLVDGEVVGEGRATSATPEAFAFDVAGLDDGRPHEIAIEHYHDTAARTLHVTGLEVGAASLDPADAVQDVGPRDGQDIVTGPAAGILRFNGTLVFDWPDGSPGGAGDPPPPPPPDPEPEPPPDPEPPGADGVTRIELVLRKAAGSDFSKLKVFVDGTQIDDLRITSSNPTSVTLEVAGLAPGGPHELALEHYHDTAARALQVDRILVDGAAIPQAGWIEDVGARDGHGIETGAAAASVDFNGTVIVQFEAGHGGPAPVWSFAGPRAFAAGADELVLGSLAGPSGPIDLAILGDSITVLETWRLPDADTFPNKLLGRLADQGYEIDLIPLSVNGSATGSGLTRLADYLDGPGDRPDATILALGTNDSRFDKPIDWTEANMRGMLDLLEDAGSEVLVVGTYGWWPLENRGFSNPAEAARFEAIFADVAADYGTLFYKYLLDGILSDPSHLTLDDLHPNAAGYEVMLDRMMPSILAMLDRLDGDGAPRSDFDLATGTLVFELEASSVTGRRTVLSELAAAGDADRLILAIEDGALVLERGDGGELMRSADGALVARRTAEVRLTFAEGGGAALWLDDVLLDETTQSIGRLGDDGPLVFGARLDLDGAGGTATVGDEFAGTIEAVRLFDEVVAPDGIA